MESFWFYVTTRSRCPSDFHVCRVCLLGVSLAYAKICMRGRTSNAPALNTAVGLEAL